MVERARLESWYRGNSIEGSNPFLSAITTENQRFTLVFLCLDANEACFGEWKRYKKTKDAEGVLIFNGLWNGSPSGIFGRKAKNPSKEAFISICKTE